MLRDSLRPRSRVTGLTQTTFTKRDRDSMCLKSGRLPGQGGRGGCSETLNWGYLGVFTLWGLDEPCTWGWCVSGGDVISVVRSLFFRSLSLHSP